MVKTMTKAEMVKEYFEELQKEDYSKGSLKIANDYFDDNVGMGEMNLNLAEIRGAWYFVNTDLDVLLLQPVEMFADELVDAITEELSEWAEGYYDEHHIAISRRLGYAE